MVYEISDSKAIMGAAFIHYIIYCVFYTIDAIKMAKSDEPTQESHDPNVQKAKKKQEGKRNEPRAAGSPAKGPDGSPVPNDNFGGNKPGAGVEMKEIDIDLPPGEENKSNKPPGVGPGPRASPSQRAKAGDDNEDEEEDFDKYDDDGAPFFNQIVMKYPKSIIWYFLLLAFAAARAATPFGIAMAYISLLGRGVQIIGAFTGKPIIGYIGYGISVVVLICLYGNVMIYEAD